MKFPNSILKVIPFAFLGRPLPILVRLPGINPFFRHSIRMSGGLVPLKTNATSAGTLFGAGGGGGGGGANPVVSTLTFSQGDPTTGNTNGTINMSSILNILDPAVPTPDNFHFQYATNQNPQAGGFPSYVAQYQSSFNGFSVFGPSADVNNTGSFAFSTDILGRSHIVAANANGNLSTLVLSADSVLVPTGMSVSSLSVSSINGAAPGGGNAYPLPSTLKSGESTGLSLNASSLTTLAAWSTISSHFYTVSVDLLPKQLTQTFGPTDAYQTQLTTDDGVVNILNNGLWSEVSTLYNAAIQLTPGLGGSATFKAGGTFMTLDVLNTSVLNTLSTNLNGVYAVDHGPGN